jgi:MFS transporter, DHA2 family, methylenomycin A resistance protein
VLLTVMAAYSASMMALSPVSVVMPTLARSFDANVELSTWILNAYLIAMVGAMLPAGRLGDRYGHVAVFRAGVIAFTVLSFACGLAPGLPSLLVLRALQGLASALLLGNAMAIVSNTFPPEQKGRAIGGVTLSAQAGASLGILAGTLLIGLSWRWTFWIAVPLALLGALGTLHMRDDLRHLDRNRRVDWAGAGLLFLTLAAFSLGLNHLHDGEETLRDGWSWHLPMHVLAAFLFLVFLRVQRRVKEPIMPLHLFRHRAFTLALIANTVLHLIMLAAMYIVPFTLQRGHGLPPAYSAGVTIVLQMMAVVLAPLAGWLFDRGAGRWMIPGSMMTMAAMVFTFSLTGPQTPYTTFVAVALGLGVAMGFFLTPNNSLIMSGLPEGLRGFGSGMLETTRQLGHSVGATIVGSLVGAGVDAGAPWAGFRAAWLAMLLISLVGLAASWMRIGTQAPEASRPAGRAIGAGR